MEKHYAKVPSNVSNLNPALCKNHMAQNQMQLIPGTKAFWVMRHVIKGNCDRSSLNDGILCFFNVQGAGKMPQQ